MREFVANAPSVGLFMPLGKEVKIMQCWYVVHCFPVTGRSLVGPGRRSVPVIGTEVLLAYSVHMFNSMRKTFENIHYRGKHSI